MGLSVPHNRPGAIVRGGIAAIFGCVFEVLPNFPSQRDRRGIKVSSNVARRNAFTLTRLARQRGLVNCNVLLEELLKYSRRVFDPQNSAYAIELIRGQLRHRLERLDFSVSNTEASTCPSTIASCLFDPPSKSSPVNFVVKTRVYSLAP